MRQATKDEGRRTKDQNESRVIQWKRNARQSLLVVALKACTEGRTKMVDGVLALEEEGANLVFWRALHHELTLFERMV
jgi:hypothetical protein